MGPSRGWELRSVAPVHTEQVWYVAYGSNLSLDRFRCYLVGGRSPGASRTYPGCRDQRPPADVRSLRIPGGLYFAGQSSVWGGGMAFLDPVAPVGAADGFGVADGLGVAARAYLLSRSQFRDVMTQEMHAVPRGDLVAGEPDPLTALADGQHLAVGPGRYETVVRVGTLDHRSLLTFTAPTSAGADLQPPSRAYLQVLSAGLRETHGWSCSLVAEYLLAWPGMTPSWSRATLLDLSRAST